LDPPVEAERDYLPANCHTRKRANNMPLLKDTHFASFVGTRRLQNPTLTKQDVSIWPPKANKKRIQINNGHRFIRLHDPVAKAKIFAIAQKAFGPRMLVTLLLPVIALISFLSVIIK
jgi:hypothetical protein